MAKGGRMKANGRSAGEQYINLPYNTIHSLAWRSLGGNSVRVYLELRSRFNGSNNGRIRLSYADGCKTLSIGRSTLENAYAELVEKGFIKLRKGGHFYGRKAHEWEVTDKPFDGHPPSRDWVTWKPQKTKHGSKVEHKKLHDVPIWDPSVSLCSKSETVRHV